MFLVREFLEDARSVFGVKKIRAHGLNLASIA